MTAFLSLFINSWVSSTLRVCAVLGRSEVPKEIKLKFDNDVDKFIASFGTVEWAKNLGIYQEGQTETKAAEAAEATEAKQ